MRLLVISHNVFSKTGNMGKTLKSYFEGWNVDEIAQLYVHSEIPTDDICHNYYRITDKEMIKSIFTRKSGRVFTEADIKRDAITTRTDTGNTAKLYQKARKRTPFIYFARNLWWKMGKWKTKKLLSWIDDFNPDIIFFASGDYAFIYDVALELAKYKSIPLVVSCMDDYYLYNKNAKKAGGKAQHKKLMKSARRVMEYSSGIFTICEKMTRDYSELFGKPCYTLSTSSTITEPLSFEKTNNISYMGNLGYNRNEQIVALGKALKKLECEGKPEYIDVYSQEIREEILKDLNEENGIKFHGKIGADEVLRIMGSSLAVIHTESFHKISRNQVKYSVSTKVADSLASGTPILAYGPEEIASIEYLKENDSAFCASDEKELEGCLKSLISDEQRRSQIIENALNLAKKNHNGDINRQMLKNKLEEICSK